MITGIDLNTRTYKSAMQEITKSVTKLQQFTNNLQTKIDNMLKAHETEIVNSYKNHMFKIKQEFDYLKMELKKKDTQIMEYQNQGKMSILLKRISFLEAEEKKLLNDLEKKKSQIKELQLEQLMQKSELKRFEEKIKELMRSKAQITQKIQGYKDFSCLHRQSNPTFASESEKAKSNKRFAKMRTQQKSLKLTSQMTEITANPQINFDVNRLQKQISQLKKQNRELISYNSKYIQNNNEIQTFFIEMVNEMRKNITSRKQIKQCSLDDFRKQDKLELLIKILSNEKILFQLYFLIFGKNDNPFVQQDKSRVQKPISMRYKLGVNKSSDYRFPSVNSSRIY